MQLVKPLTVLTSSSKPFHWTHSAQVALDELKRRFTSAPILRLPDRNLQYILEVDPSHYAIGAVLSQRESENHPVAFFSKTLSSAESNYPIGEKELLAMKLSLEHWRHLLKGTTLPILVYTDHSNLQYICKTLSTRQVRWTFFFDRFNFISTFRPGTKNGKADALSRLGDPPPAHQHPQSIIPESKLLATIVPLKEELLTAQKQDDLCSSLDADSEGFHYHNGLLYIPPTLRHKILQFSHDAPLAGHPGMN